MSISGAIAPHWTRHATTRIASTNAKSGGGRIAIGAGPGGM